MQKWPVEIEIPVQWGDMDAFGHVNNVQYIRWFESVRIEYFLKMQLKEFVSNEAIGPILAHIEADYRLPIQFPDTVIAKTNISHIGNSSLGMEYQIYSKKANKIAATGKGVIVMLDYRSGQKQPVSAVIRNKISACQGEVRSLLEG
tara:strand:- start:21822 stop:22259 length:438 start_codon:yes stop_codon:yes gene_type:complete